MLKSVLLIAGVALLTGCASKDTKPAPVLVTPGSRIIYHDTAGHAMWHFCDRGNLIYMNSGGWSQVIPDGCRVPDGQPK